MYIYIYEWLLDIFAYPSNSRVFSQPTHYVNPR